MSNRSNNIWLFAASLGLGICVSAVILTAGPAWTNTTGASSATQVLTQANVRSSRRNLSLQPEALRLSRRLGNRFTSAARHSSIVSGNLIIGTNQQQVNIVRQQTDRSESIQISAGVNTFTWNDLEGAKTFTGFANEVERVLIERLVFDSPDWFVLAQLRGASYQNIGRSVRPAEVGGSENYTGPVWDIV